MPVKRLVQARGATAREQGRALGRAAADSIHTMYALKLEQYSEIAGAVDRWDEIVGAVQPLMERLMPHTYAELLGQAEGADISPQALLRMSTEYELSMSSVGERAVADKCTGLVAHNIEGGVSVIGQNNDENMALWMEGKLDYVADLRQPQPGMTPGSPLDALVYTHPGVPAYMGVNSVGVSVTWYYIDDGERALSVDNMGLPTCAILREMLTFPSALDAVAWLHSIPRAVPNAYLVADPTRSFEVECGPIGWDAVAFPACPDSHRDLARAGTSSSSGGPYGTHHANHYKIDSARIGRDTRAIGPTGTSPFRGHSMRASVDVAQRAALETGAAMGVSQAKAALSTGGGVLGGVQGPNTLVSLVFEPTTRAMHARFHGDNAMAAEEGEGDEQGWLEFRCEKQTEPVAAVTLAAAL